MKKLVLILVAVILLAGVVVVYAQDTEKLTLEWRALVAEYNLAFSKFQQASPEVKSLNEFLVKIDKQGLTLDKEGKIIEKPKVETPKKGK